MPNDPSIFIELGIDWDELATRSDPAGFPPEKLKLLGRENRLEVLLIQLKAVDSAAPRSAVELSLRLLAHAHPECSFKWIDLKLDFAAIPQARVEDFSPKEVKGTEPIKITSTYKGGLSFELETAKLGPNVELERSKEYQIYFPEILGSGIGTSMIHWTFSALPGQKLYEDRELKALVSAAAGVVFEGIELGVKAKLQVEGALGWLPVVGRKRVEGVVMIA